MTLEHKQIRTEVYVDGVEMVVRCTMMPEEYNLASVRIAGVEVLKFLNAYTIGKIFEQIGDIP